MSKGKSMLFALVLLVGMITSVQVRAAEVTPWATVVAIQSGWVVDRMLVFHNGAVVNPDGCSLVTNGYIIKETDPARKTFYDMLIAAKVNSRQVSFVIEGCFELRPRIISVSLR